MLKYTYITDLLPVYPPFKLSQQKTLDWVASTHTEAESLAKGLEEEEKAKFQSTLSSLLKKLGLGPEKIQQRNLYFDDFFKDQTEDKMIYDFKLGQRGALLDGRMALYSQVSFEVFKNIYELKQLPEDLIHTTCTGYSSPSPAQRLLSEKKNGHLTTLTHAYHMGCYASIPSIRMGSSFIHKGSRSCDVVHTEFCSLHMDPLNHSLGQLVIESLFADGAISYQLVGEAPKNKKSLKILDIREELIPDSLHGMSWQPSHFGFAMTLSKEVPQLIARYVKPFVDKMLIKSGLNPETQMIYAIHPGGPKIIDEMKVCLNLEQEMVKHSCEVLKNHGNMSSATLPHVWEKILQDDTISDGTPIVSLAFGPGLTIAGAVFQKCSS